MIEEPLTKPVPFTVRLNAAPPATVLAGTVEVTVGAGLLMAKLMEDEVPPPGVGVLTATEAVPALATSVAAIAAWSWFELTNVVLLTLPFHRTVEPLTNPFPFTVTVNAAPPDTALAGTTEVTVGAALLIAKLREDELPPPGAGVLTATEAVPALATSVAAIAAWSWFELTNVVLLALPFHRTVEPLTNPVPFTVSVNAGLAVVALLGEIETTLGTGF